MILVALFLAGGFLMAWLIWLNWIGRKKMGMYESNRIYRWFDRRGMTTVALVIHFSIITSLFTAWLFMGEIVGMSIIVGVLLTNAMIDNASINRHRTCERSCPEFGECMNRRRRTCFKIWDNAKRRLFR